MTSECARPGQKDIAIRQATLDDFSALSRIFRRSSLSNTGDRAALLANPSALELSQESIIEGRTRVAVVDGTGVVGFATLAPAEGGLELEDLFVDPLWMRMGIGRALIADAALSASVRGIRRIDVTANPHALALYQKVGFRVAGTVDTTFRRGYRMHLTLAP